MSFSEKLISVTFTLAQGEFEGGGNTVTVSGARISATITNRGGAEQSYAELTIFGLPLSIMNQLSNVATHLNKTNPNGVQILAGDAVDGESLVFSGQIATAFVDAQSMPEVSFHVSATPGFYDKMKPIPPTSVSGPASVATLMGELAKSMGMAFENNGVTAKLAFPYYWGTAWEQASQIAKDAGIEWTIDRGTLAIMNPGSPRKGGTVPIFSPTTGMVGYPVFNQTLVIITALFNPDVQFQGEMEVQSQLTSANGRFIIISIVYELESLTPNGRWHMTLTGVVQGYTVP